MNVPTALPVPSSASEPKMVKLKERPFGKFQKVDEPSCTEDFADRKYRRVRVFQCFAAAAGPDSL
jgi:hypothetical protein